LAEVPDIIPACAAGIGWQTTDNKVEGAPEAAVAIDATADTDRQIRSAELSQGRIEPTSNPARSVRDEMTYRYKVVSSRTSRTGVGGP
jgi:hypothetical protein